MEPCDADAVLAADSSEDDMTWFFGPDHTCEPYIDTLRREYTDDTGKEMIEFTILHDAKHEATCIWQIAYGTQGPPFVE